MQTWPSLSSSSLRETGRSRRLARWAICAVSAALLTAGLAVPAAAATQNHFFHLESSEGVSPGGTDTFNEVSTDGGATWTHPVVVTAASGWVTITGTEWISVDSTRGDPGRAGTTTLFRRQFSLAPGFVSASVQLCGYADDAVTVTVNGTPVALTGAPPCAAIGSLLHSGANSILFAVTNGTGPMGLDFSADGSWDQDDAAKPLLHLPADITVAAAGPAGTLVNYSANGVDVDGLSLDATCIPPSNSVFPAGQVTTVNCSTTGTNGTTEGSFTVTVGPWAGANLPPVLSLPSGIRVNTESTRGKIVAFSASASDDSGIPPTVSCVPPSGSRFPVGVTTVTCTATDDQGLASTGSFTVTVIGPLERACALLQQALSITTKSPLVTTLRAAAENLRDADRDRDASTISSLATKVKNSGPSVLGASLRKTVRETVHRVMDRACCQPPLPQA